MEFNELVESLGNNVTQLRNSDLNKTITELQNMVRSNLTIGLSGLAFVWRVMDGRERFAKYDRRVRVARRNSQVRL